MTWSTYGSFLAFAAVLVLVPGPDFAVVTRNTLAAGRRRGSWSAVGVASSNAVQGVAAAAGLGALVVRSQPVFQAIKWAGVAYLLFLGAQALQSAAAGRYAPLGGAGGARAGQTRTGWRQGFLSNITNPRCSCSTWQSCRSSSACCSPSATRFCRCSTCWPWSPGLGRARRVLSRRGVRRALDAATGVVLVGFSARLATERT